MRKKCLPDMHVDYEEVAAARIDGFLSNLSTWRSWLITVARLLEGALVAV
jgi:hypothetical protein